MVDRAVNDFKGRVQIVEVNLDKQENLQFSEKYQVTVIPTYVFLDSRGNIVDRAAGSLTKDVLYEKLRSLEGK